MYVCMYVCMYIYTYICICVCVRESYNGSADLVKPFPYYGQSHSGLGMSSLGFEGFKGLGLGLEGFKGLGFVGLKKSSGFVGFEGFTV